ncbi:glycoprotease [Phlyctema vagabunda]|uniref:Glycoprotease n=1 Tax=Phlyctema vagabunda TaxID=108571 RepID=A0ABR4P255_9HELO
MRQSCHLIRRAYAHPTGLIPRRTLLTLAIETSCDDTSVAVLEKHTSRKNSATLHYHAKITSDNRAAKGVQPIVAHESHQKTLSGLVKEALQHLPLQAPDAANLENALLVRTEHGALQCRKKPDFVTATRGPGMRANLITGVDTAKGLAVAWQVPFLGVNHMQAHALTPRLVSALEAEENGNSTTKVEPEFPFLTLLVSGGHTMLVHSRHLCNHEILASSLDKPIGNSVDHSTRDILPLRILESVTDVMYGRTLENFAFPEEQPEYGYRPVFNSKGNFVRRSDDEGVPSLGVPLSQRATDMAYSFSGLSSEVRRCMEKEPEMDESRRRTMARQFMQVAFEHLASRVLLALKMPAIKDVKTLVVSGGVASNQFLKHVLRTVLDARGHQELRLVFPPPKYCTDNAAMIAWTGIETWEAGWRTDLSALAVNKWSIDPRADDGGILGLDGWLRSKDV